MSDAEAIVDWGLAERTATALIAGVPGPFGRDPGPARLYGAPEVESACERALGQAPVDDRLGVAHGCAALCRTSSSVPSISSSSAATIS